MNDLSEVRTYGKKATPLVCAAIWDTLTANVIAHLTRLPVTVQGFQAPLLDRIDMQIEVPAVPQEELMRQHSAGEKSSLIRQRVEKSHQLQLTRQEKTNSRLSVKEIDQFCALDTASENLLKNAIHRLNLSARAYHRILKVARTIADLSAVEKINNQHIAEAIQYRRLGKY